MTARDFIKLIFIRFPFGFKLLHLSGLKKDFEVKTFLEEIHKGNVVYDIGANKGRFTNLFSLITGRAGRVIAFEPVQQNIDRLIKLGKRFPQIQIHKIAVSDTTRETQIFLPENDSAQSSLQKQDFGNWKTAGKIISETCKTEPLDSYTSENDIPPPDFIKIDTEGAEAMVLKGASDILDQYSPILFLEINEPTLKTFNTSGLNILKYLTSKGYRTFSLVTLIGVFAVDENNFEDILQNHFSPNLLAKK